MRLIGSGDDQLVNSPCVAGTVSGSTLCNVATGYRGISGGKSSGSCADAWLWGLVEEEPPKSVELSFNRGSAAKERSSALLLGPLAQEVNKLSRQAAKPASRIGRLSNNTGVLD